jgi:hypothetical protein
MEEKRDAVGHEEIEDPGPRHRSEYPRSLYTLPNGDVLVMESKAPKAAAIKRPEEIVMGYGVSGMDIERIDWRRPPKLILAGTNAPALWLKSITARPMASIGDENVWLRSRLAQMQEAARCSSGVISNR